MKVQLKQQKNPSKLKFHQIDLVYIDRQTTADNNSLEHATEG